MKNDPILCNKILDNHFVLQETKPPIGFKEAVKPAAAAVLLKPLRCHGTESSHTGRPEKNRYRHFLT